MARKRMTLGNDVDSKIAAGTAKGWSAEAIHARLVADGVDVSLSTVRRRKAEAKKTGAKARGLAKTRPGAGSAPASAPFAPLPEEPEDLPSDAGLGQINYWLSIAERNAREAEEAGESETLVKMVRFAVMLLEAKRKATPIPKADPNENPDMVAIAEAVRARLHKMIDQVAPA